MKSFLKIWIITIIIIIVLILVLLIKYLNINNNFTDIDNKNEASNNNIQTNEIANNISNTNVIENNNTIKITQLKDRKYYLMVEDVVLDLLKEMRLYNSEQLLKDTYNLNAEDLIKEKNKIKESLKIKISKKYQDEFNLENILNGELLSNILIKEAYSIENIYQYQKGNSKISIFLVYGQFTTTKTEYSLMVAYDRSTNAYEVYLNEYMKKNNYTISNLQDIDIDVKSIKKEEYNIMNRYTTEQANEEIAKRYLINVRTKIKNNPEEIYNLLDEEYKNKKFLNLESFVEFSKEVELSLSHEYKIINQGNYYEIICKDDLGNKIIFKETAVMQYTILLDPYTVEIETIKEEYDTTDQEKVRLNIEKLTQMINMRDYNAIYERLNDTFKKNNFSTIEQLKKHIEDYLYSRSKIEIISTEEGDNYYTTRIRIINDIDKRQRKLGTIFMALGEGTNFEMSFSIDK